MKILLFWCAVITSITPFFLACDFQPSKEIKSQHDQEVIERGRDLTYVHGCTSCHKIPGMKGNPENIGPPLFKWSKRKYIAGLAPNTPKELVKWIMNPHDIDKDTSMPDLNISKDEAKDIMYFLNSLK